MGHELYVLKTKFAESKESGANILMTDEEQKIERIQKDQLVTMLKRNLDVATQKQETLRTQNLALEERSKDKEARYEKMKKIYYERNDKISTLEIAYTELQ